MQSHLFKGIKAVYMVPSSLEISEFSCFRDNFICVRQQEQRWEQQEGQEIKHKVHLSKAIHLSKDETKCLGRHDSDSFAMKECSWGLCNQMHQSDMLASCKTGLTSIPCTNPSFCGRKRFSMTILNFQLALQREPGERMDVLEKFNWELNFDGDKRIRESGDLIGMFGKGWTLTVIDRG